MNRQDTHDSSRGRSGAAAAEQLRGLVRSALAGLFTEFLGQVQAGLQKAGAGTQPLAASLSAHAANWRDGFIKHVDSQLVGGLAGSTQESGRRQGDGEDVALAGMELRAEARYQALISDLDAGFERVRQRTYVPVYARALAPAGLYRSLHDTAAAQGWPAAQRVFLSRQFEASFIARLVPVYQKLLQDLDGLSELSAPEPQVTAPSDTPPDGVTQRILRQPLPTPPDALTGQVDGATLAMLKACTANSRGEGYTDGSLAADLLSLTEHKPLPGMSAEQCEAPLQRMELAGRLLNDVMDNPLVPAEMRPQQEAMRLPLIKSALADPSLFTEAAHPLRSLVNEFMHKSALSKLTNSAETRRLADLLNEVLENFNLAPDFVREAMTKAEPIQQAQIQTFFKQQRQQAEESRQAVISEAKRLVGRELQRLSFGPDVPAPALQFLDQAWGPVATQQLLKYGAGDEHWTGTLKLVEDIMDALETREPDEPPTPEWKDLMRRVSDTMTAEGMSKGAIKQALSGLEAARNTVA